MGQGRRVSFFGKEVERVGIAQAESRPKHRDLAQRMTGYYCGRGVGILGQIQRTVSGRALVALVTAAVTTFGTSLSSDAVLPRAEADDGLLQARGFEEVDLEAAQAWDGYRIYYAGVSYLGVPLTEILKYKRYGRQQWAFIYGDCEPAPEDGICFPPLEVINSSVCNDFPARYFVVPRTFPFRGARAARNYAGGTFDVYTGRTSATTVTSDGRGQGLAAEELRPVGASAPARLRRPAKGSLGGKLRCQRRWKSDVNGPHGDTLRADRHRAAAE